MVYGDPSWRGTSNSPAGPEPRIIRRDIADLMARDGDQLPNGCEAYVLGQGTNYRLDTSSPSFASSPFIIRRTVANGNWLRSDYVSAVPAWFVDATNGNDANDGQTAATAFKTSEKLSQTLCPGFQVCTLQQNTTITLAAGSYGRLDLNIDWPADTGLEGKVLSIRGAFTSTTDMALTAVTNTTNGSVRGQITVGSGALIAKRRIRSTSGANIGAICYSTGSNAGSATNHFVSTWFNYNSEHNVNIVNGTNVAIDTLAVSIKILTLQNAGQGYVELRDCIQTGPWACPADCEGDLNGRQTFLAGCELSGEVTGLFYAQQCRTIGNVTAICSNIGGCEFDGCSIQNVLNISGFCDFGGLGTNTVDGGRINFLYGLHLIAFSCEFENGIAGAALAIINMTVVQENDATVFLWGLTAATWTTGIAISSNCQLIAGAAANHSIPSAQQMTLSGQNFAFANMPIALPETGASATLAADAQAVSTTALSTYQIPAARGNQGATTLATAPRKAAYEFWAYFAPTVAGTLGPAVQVNAIFKDDSGTRTVPVLAAGVDVTTLTGNGGVITIETDGVADVQFSVTGVTTQGALQYSLRAGIRILTPG